MEELRAELAAIDRQILGLIARRQELAESIGQVKDRGELSLRDFAQVKDRGELSLRDFAQEKEVIERSRALAGELGISTEVGEQVMRLLIEYSLTAQERQRVAAQGGGGGRRALVIGGSGRMGAWFTRFLAFQGFEVEVADPEVPAEGLPHLADWRESPLDHDLVVVAAGLRATQQILSEMIERRPEGVVFDIGSLKSPLRQPLSELAAAGVEVASSTRCSDRIPSFSRAGMSSWSTWEARRPTGKFGSSSVPPWPRWWRWISSTTTGRWLTSWVCPTL
jgi:chorismate mutase/prephenate dehydrogenase